MTAIKAVLIRCDHPSGCDSVSNYDGWPDETTAREARTRARQDGWKRTREGLDICPEVHEAEEPPCPTT